MDAETLLRPETGEHMVSSDRMSDAVRILERDINLFVWRRTLDRESSLLLDEFNRAHELAFDQAVDVPERDIGNALAAYPEGEARSFLCADVVALCRCFATLTGCTRLRVRLETVATSACRLFHVDAAPLRMLVTYSGSGTEWVSNDNVRRHEMGLKGRGIDETNAAIVIRSPEVRVARQGWVMVLKGEGYDGNLDSGIVHRSPPLADGAMRRLRLCVEPVAAPIMEAMET